MVEFLGLLGWITVIFFTLSILNFFIKYINKKFINKLSKEKREFAHIYRKMMKFFIKFHYLFGIVAILTLLLHFIIVITYMGLNISGVVAALLMFAIVILGLYGKFLNKKDSRVWIKIHKILSFLLIAAILYHIFLGT